MNLFWEVDLFRESGATAYGPDLSQWDARMVDAQAVIESCRNASHNTEFEALHPK